VRSLTVGRLLAIALVTINSASVAAGQGLVSDIARQAFGSFVFTDRHPITVWFCRPPSLSADSRIVFVMHGSESQTARQACDIASPELSILNAIVLAPQFSEQYYPHNAYMFGNMIDAAGRTLPKPQWALTTIERLFDVVRHDLALKCTEYDIVGFSGGAQFVHRLVLFVPDARFRRAVAASAGQYAFPTWSARFPYGLAGSPVERGELAKAFSRDLVVLLGDRDIVDRERERDAMMQGTNRFARGLRFFATATDEAIRLDVPLRWQIQIVHDVEHAPVPMVRAALQLLR
jgi:poly(3-hydroxybutyrate) depolymerase